MFNQNDNRSKLGKIAENLGIYDVHKFILDQYNNKMSCETIAKWFNERGDGITITGKRISDVIKYHGKIRGKREARKIAIETGRMIYKKKEKIFDRIAIPLKIRYYVLQRDGFKCRACGSGEGLEVDHIKEVWEGGSNNPDNLQILCYLCNKGKTQLKIHGV